MRFIYFLTILSINVFAAEEIPFLQGEYNPAKWPEAHLKLSQAGTLKDIFDSGLRPYRFPGCESSTLEVKHIQLNIHLASGKILPEIPAEWLHIKMFNDGELSQIEGATPQLSLLEAREEMSKWLPYGTRPKEDLDKYLKAVEADPLDFDDPFRGLPDGCGVGWKEPGWKEPGGGPQCSIWFRNTFSEIEPLKLYFKLSWGSNRPSKMRTGYDIPIPPPPGYEHVSMKAPEKFGPDSGVDILRSKGVDIGDGKGGIPYHEYKKSQNDKVNTSSRSQVTSPPVTTTASAEKSSHFWLWLLGIFLLLSAISGWMWKRFFKKSP